MIHLIYASSAKASMPLEELLALLAKARDKNARLGVTGMLLYKNGNFLQVLEGEEKTVKDLFAVIRADPRHYGVLPIAQRTVEKRHFENWSMAFSNLNSLDPQDIPGYSEFLNQPFTPQSFEEKPSMAEVFLNMFKEGLR